MGRKVCACRFKVFLNGDSKNLTFYEEIHSACNILLRNVEVFPQRTIRTPWFLDQRLNDLQIKFCELFSHNNCLQTLSEFYTNRDDNVAQSDLDADFRTTEVLSQDPAKNAEILRHKRSVPGTSDGGAHVKFFSGGHYSTEMISWLVREEGLLSLEDVHFRMSLLPARILGLDRRGTLIEGNAADLYVYDYDSIGYERDNYAIRNDLPNDDWRRIVPAQGIDWVIVNGEPIFNNSETCAKALPGQLVSNQGAEMDARLCKAA